MQEPPNATPTSTEEIPPTPGWVEQAVDEIFLDPQISLPQRPSLRLLRNAYLDCLAGAGRTSDINEWHDRCRRELLTTLCAQEGVSAEQARILEDKLEALEAEISARV